MKDSAVGNSVGDHGIRLEISGDKLGELLNCGALCVADFRCLDPDSKSCVWRLCLGACVQQDLKKDGAIHSWQYLVEARL